MTDTRAYSWTVSTASIVLVAQVALCVPLQVNAASTAGEAVVRVMAQPTALGTLSFFTVNVSNPQHTSKTINAVPQQTSNTAFQAMSNEGAQIQPAVFSISGLASQTFAIVIPASGVLASSGGSVQFSKFTHNAGSTPVIGANGSAVFAVGANVQFTPTLDLETASGPGAAFDSAADSGEAKDPAKKPVLPTPKPFGMLGIQDGFMNVLISYN